MLGVLGDRHKNCGGWFFGVALSFTPYPYFFCFMPLCCGKCCGLVGLGKWQGLAVVCLVLRSGLAGCFVPFLCLDWLRVGKWRGSFGGCYSWRVALCVPGVLCYGSGSVGALSVLVVSGLWVKRREVLALALMYSLSVCLFFLLSGGSGG